MPNSNLQFKPVRSNRENGTLTCMMRLKSPKVMHFGPMDFTTGQFTSWKETNIAREHVSSTTRDMASAAAARVLGRYLADLHGRLGHIEN